MSKHDYYQIEYHPWLSEVVYYMKFLKDTCTRNYIVAHFKSSLRVCKTLEVFSYYLLNGVTSVPLDKPNVGT